MVIPAWASKMMVQRAKTVMKHLTIAARLDDDMIRTRLIS